MTVRASIENALWYVRNSVAGWSAPERIGNDDVVVSTITLDSFGRAHVAYITGEFTLKYARKVNETWLIETIDESIVWSGTSIHLPLMLDAQGNPHIAYISSGVLKYAHRFGGAWTIETVDATAHVFCSFALDSTGRPHIAYQDASYPLMYATKTEAGWQFESVYGLIYYGLELALDALDRPHICFGAGYEQVLTYAWKPQSSWVYETIHPQWNQGYLGVSLAVTLDGIPHVAWNRWSSSEVFYATHGQGGWEVQSLDNGSGQDPRITLDDRSRPHLVYSHHVGGGVQYVYYGREAEAVEVIGAASDTTLYENGVDIVHLQVRTRRYFGPAGSVALSADLVPSIGPPTYHAGDDVFSLNVGEEHVSELSWAVPDTAYPWEFDLKVSLEDGMAGTRSPLTDRFFRNMFRAAKLPVTYLRQYFGLVVNCQQLDPETECLYQMAATVPVVGTSTAGVVLYYQNMCRAQEFMRRGDRCRAGMAFAQGMTVPAKLLVDALTGGVPSLIAKAKMLQSAGGAAVKCWQSEFAYDAHCGPRSGGALAGAGSAFVDSLASWMEAGIDSTETDVADALLVGGDFSIRVEADSAWADADSLGLVFAHVMPFEQAGAVAMVTTQVHRLRGSKADNPHSASTFRLQSRAVQPLNLCLLHYDGEGERLRLSYAEFSVTESTRLILNVRDDQAEFPLYVDFDGDGAIDEVHYPGGVVVGQDPGMTPGIRTELDLARPNPFNPRTTISFSLAMPGQIALSIYDATGRLVARPLEGHLEAGRHEVVWEGRAENGTRLASGVYFCRLESGPVTITRQLVLIK